MSRRRRVVATLAAVVVCYLLLGAAWVTMDLPPTVTAGTPHRPVSSGTADSPGQRPADPVPSTSLVERLVHRAVQALPGREDGPFSASITTLPSGVTSGARDVAGPLGPVPVPPQGSGGDAGARPTAQPVPTTGTAGDVGTRPGAQPTQPGAPVGVGAPSCLANDSGGRAPCQDMLRLGPVNDLALGAADVVPGDRIERALDLTTTSGAFSSFVLTTRDVAASPLTRDPQTGLQLRIDRCSVPWTPTQLAEGGRSYRCVGQVVDVLAPQDPRRGATLSAVPLTGLTVTGGPGTDHLRLVLSLPDDAPLSLAGAASLVHTFTGTSR